MLFKCFTTTLRLRLLQVVAARGPPYPPPLPLSVALLPALALEGVLDLVLALLFLGLGP